MALPFIPGAPLNVADLNLISQNTTAESTISGFNGTIVASIVYDTKKDSDGGAWRKRCTGTSWYNEVSTATGKWLGYFTTPLLAVNSVATSAVGDYYFNTTDNLFYSIATITGTPVSATAATGVQIYRGSRKEFPEVVAITAEASRVIIWDLTDSSVPMWMVFPAMGLLIGATVSALAAIQGRILIGTTAQGYKGASFVNDKKIWTTSVGDCTFADNTILTRGVAYTYTYTPSTALVSSLVNSVAATVLPNAPIDPATGLSVPTIAVGTAGGGSIIRDDGGVSSYATASYESVSFLKSTGDILFYRGGTAAFYKVTYGNYSGSTFVANLVYNGVAGLAAAQTYKIKQTNQYEVLGGGAGLALSVANPASLTSSLVAAITNTYNSGWMNGDIRLATLADTVTETVSGTNLIINGTFDSGISGWTATVGIMTWDPVNQRLGLNGSGLYTANQRVTSTAPITLKATYQYTVKCDTIAGTGNTFFIRIGTDAAGGATTPGMQVGGYVAAVGGSYQFTVTASGNYYISLIGPADNLGQTVYFDNISMIEGASDRSVKANPLTLQGSLIKSQVNTGTQLVAYSGFSDQGDFNAPLTSSLVLKTGTGNPTFTRATPATILDYEGILRTVPSNCARFEGARYVQNLYGAASSSLTVGTQTSITVTAGTYAISIGTGLGAVTLAGNCGASGLLYTNPSYRTSMLTTVVDGTLIITGINATVTDLQVENVNGQSKQIQLSKKSRTFVQPGVPLTKTVGVPGVVASFVYDTTNDSDGGLWRNRCSTTSWYNETIYGTYRGDCATEAVCRAISGATTNDYYHNTTDGNFYALNATSGQTVVYRGNKRMFPEVAGITAEAGRVIIWDLTDPTIPMWMVFTRVVSGVFWNDNNAALSVNMIQGIFLLGTAGGAWRLNFISEVGDRMYSSSTVATGVYIGTIANRNSFGTVSYSGTNVATIVNGTVNSIASTVLSGAPLDSISGLPVPTVAVGTAGGVSVIKQDGIVYNPTSPGNTFKVGFLKNNTLIYGALNTNQYQLSASGITLNSAPTLIFGNYAVGTTTYPIQSSSQLQVCSATGLIVTASPAFNIGMSVIKHNESTPSSGLNASISNTYNSGWMNGDIRLAALADTTIGTISPTQYVINGDNEIALVTTNTVANGTLSQSTTQVASGTYSAAYTSTNVTAVVHWVNLLLIPANVSINYSFQGFIPTLGGLSQLKLVDNNDGSHLSTAITTKDGWVTITGSRSGKSTSWNLAIGGPTVEIVTGVGFYLDNISVTFTENDRSVKANPLTVVGTLTKSPVATGSQLVAYFGFSVGNYLTQPYSANLDFGTGDFCIMGWIKGTSNGANQCIFERIGSTVTMFDIYIATNVTIFRIGASSFVNGTKVVLDGSWHLITCLRKSGVAYTYVDGVLDASIANTNSVTDTTAPLFVGIRSNGSSAPLNQGSISLLRFSATAPTQDQIAYIYETERKLFEPNTNCTIQGTSSAVTAMSYDSDTDLLEVGTSWGTTDFKGLKAVSSSAIGAVVTLSTQSGFKTIGQTSTASLVESNPVVINKPASEYVSIGVLSAPYHGTGVDGIACFDYIYKD